MEEVAVKPSPLEAWLVLSVEAAWTSSRDWLTQVSYIPGRGIASIWPARPRPLEALATSRRQLLHALPSTRSPGSLFSLPP